jgi:hypothetical protein
MEPSCKAALAGLSGQSPDREAVCANVRNDGRWTDADNLELILGKLASNHEAMGILTYSYMEQFRNRIHAASIDGIAPSRVTIPSGTYPMVSVRPRLDHTLTHDLASLRSMYHLRRTLLEHQESGLRLRCELTRTSDR